MDVNPVDLSVSKTANTHLIVVCQAAYHEALALGVPAERLALIPNGVDTKTYSANRSGSTFRKALHLSPEVPLVGFVGRLAWEKGPDQFIKLAEHVHKQRPDVHFALVGEGPMETEIQEWIEESQLDQFIHMPGLWTNTWEVYPAFNLLAQTSRVEGMPFALLEAMACGCPVVAMGVGGVAEIVEVGTTGLLAAPTDWAGMGDGLVKLLDNPERIRVMGSAARKRVEELFDVQTSMRHMGALFYQITGRPLPKDLNTSSRWQLSNASPVEYELNHEKLFHKKQ
jgi:glycosyltransferase involved in cell wall biosynthesis